MVGKVQLRLILPTTSLREIIKADFAKWFKL